MLRRTFRWPAEQSPNVRYALAEIAAGKPVSNTVLVPGVMTWEEFNERRRTWSKPRQRIGLDALFPEDEGMLLFPEDWLRHSWRLWVKHDQDLVMRRKRKGKAMGIDSGEGAAQTSWATVDEHGVLDLSSEQTRDTNTIPSKTVGLARQFDTPPDRWMFDAGGGGKQHADRLRAMGYPCQTVRFGEPIMLDIKHGVVLNKERLEQRETKYVYKNRRSEMYGTLHELCDPRYENGRPTGGFALPPPDTSAAAERLYRQLAPIPIKYDEKGEGRLTLPPKAEMIATLYNNEFSPDEADALVLAVHGLTHKSRRATAGAS